MGVLRPFLRASNPTKYRRRSFELLHSSSREMPLRWSEDGRHVKQSSIGAVLLRVPCIQVALCAAGILTIHDPALGSPKCAKELQ